MEYINVDGEYLKEKIEHGGYPKFLVEKVGVVKARVLHVGEKVKIYFYNDIAEIETKTIEIESSAQVLITKTINGKEYNSIMSGIKFHKNYSKLNPNKSDSLYIPVVDAILAYEINENITFQNIFNQIVKLCPGDFIIPYDASHKHYYSIYKYNFQDNYTFKEFN
jgi:hypothetical protein